MPRPPRADRPGRLHHVMNRGLARRTVFETRRDVRVFLALLACAVRQGRIEFHAFVLLPTHFHLLVRSLDGRLSETMRRVLNAYVRWFNRTRRRDGPLFRGRFRSFPVESPRYLQTLFRYLDQNPVDARFVTSPAEYPHGSAGHHVAGRARPRWLCRSLVDQFLAPLLAEGVSRDDAYRRVFPPRLSLAQLRFVERRLLHPDRSADALQDLVAAASPEVLAWMTRKARLADGTRPGLPLVAPETVERLVATHRRRAPGSMVDVGPRRRRSVWDLALVALLRDLAGETYASTGRRHGLTRDQVARRADEHRTALASDLGYRGIAVEPDRRALEEENADSSLADRVVLDERPPVSRSLDERS
jgi:REP element-mobilizing transposase RayT